MQYEMRHITELLGIKRPALRQWVDLGFVSPSVKAEGHGTRNLWSRSDVLNLAVFQKLIEHGFTREEAAQILRDKRSLFCGGGTCTVQDRLDPEVEDILGYDTLIARVNCLDGVVYNMVVTRMGETVFEALDAAARFLEIPYGIASAKVVSITDVVRHVAKAL